MTIKLHKPDITELKPRITVFGVGGGGGNAVNNMIKAGLQGVDFVVANTDAQALTMTKADRVIQMGVQVTEGLGAGSQPEVGRAAAEECIDEIIDHLNGTHMCFVTAGMGGGTGTGAAPVVAQAARNKGILTVGVVTKPFHFEGQRRMRLAEQGIEELQKSVDTLIVIPNQNLFRIANDKTTFADAFGMADQVLYSGVACITDLMVKDGLINLDFADVRSVMREMGRAMMGTGEASGSGRAMAAAEAAIANPLLDETSMKGAQGLLISITGGRDMTLFEVDEAATRIREEVDADANIILGATFDDALEGLFRVSVVATGIDRNMAAMENRAPDFRSPVRAVNRPVNVPLPAGMVHQVQAPAQAPVQTPRTDPVAEAIRAAEADMERELDIELTKPVMQAPVETRPVDNFQPASRLFTPPARQEMPAPRQDPAPRQEMPAPRQEMRQSAPQMEMRGEPSFGGRVDTVAQDIRHDIDHNRMPKVEDFPPMVKAEMETRNMPVSQADERGPMGLLKRLTSSLGRREEEEALHDMTATAPQAPSQQRRVLSPEASLYAPKRDEPGRQAGQSQASREQEEFDIPAFLRRQSN